MRWRDVSLCLSALLQKFLTEQRAPDFRLLCLGTAAAAYSHAGGRRFSATVEHLRNQQTDTVRFISPAFDSSASLFSVLLGHSAVKSMQLKNSKQKDSNVFSYTCLLALASL